MTMGLEWHNRHRDKYGRFAPDNPAHVMQIHIRLTARQGEQLRLAAIAAHESMRTYASRALLARMKADGALTGEEGADQRDITVPG